MLTLRERWKQLTSYLYAPGTPTLTSSIAAGVRGPLMRVLLTLERKVRTSPDRLLIFLTVNAILLLGALIILTT